MVTITSFQNMYAVLHDDILVKSFRTRAQAQAFVAEYREGL